MKQVKNLLRIDASARRQDSVTRLLGDEFQTRWLSTHPGAQVTHRDLADSLPLLSEDWVVANLTEPATRDEGQRASLALSDRLIAELQQADAILVTVPLYNFGVPAAMKAWIDLICRARETFAYTEQGPKGLLADRPVTLIMASGGVPMGSAVDFASAYLRHIFGFIGIEDVRLVAAECLNLHPEEALASARDQLDNLFVGPDKAA